MDTHARAREGFVSFRGHKVWYRVAGEGEEPGRLPLLCLHGGPGAPHDYLEPLEALVRTGRRVIFYDQLGCGNSDQPRDPALWTVELYVAELGAVRRSLGLERVHVLGHSWGGMLAMAYALTRPEGLASLIIASSPASMAEWVSEADRLRAALPAEMQAALIEHANAGTIEDPAYVAAERAFYRRHLCRLDPWPACLERTFEKMAGNPEVYYTMNGPSEFHVTGVLKDWDLRDRLGEIRVPTLITSGRHDEATPKVVETLSKGIIGSEWLVFEQSSHMPHLEETDRYLDVLSRFLARVEKKA